MKLLAEIKLSTEDGEIRLNHTGSYETVEVQGFVGEKLVTYDEFKFTVRWPRLGSDSDEQEEG